MFCLKSKPHLNKLGSPRSVRRPELAGATSLPPLRRCASGEAFRAMSSPSRMTMAAAVPRMAESLDRVLTERARGNGSNPRSRRQTRTQKQTSQTPEFNDNSSLRIRDKNGFIQIRKANRRWSGQHGVADRHRTDSHFTGLMFLHDSFLRKA